MPEPRSCVRPAVPESARHVVTWQGPLERTPCEDEERQIPGGPPVRRRPGPDVHPFARAPKSDARRVPRWIFFFPQEPTAPEAFVTDPTVPARPTDSVAPTRARRTLAALAPALLFALLLALLAPVGSALATDYPLTVRDDLGRSVTLDAAPQRIVTMIPSHTETVCALGACDLLVGVDQFSNHPAEVADLPRLGNAFTPDLEALAALEPDLVLVDEDSGVAEALDRLGIPTWAGTGQSLGEVLRGIETTGRLLDRETEAALLVGRLEGRIGALRERVEDLAAPRVYYELDATPYSVGPQSYIGELIAVAGGANIVPSDLGAFPQLDPEFVVAADPQLVVLADAPFGESRETLAARPGWSGIRALQREGGVAPLTQEQVDIVNRPGPRIDEAVALLARIFHPGSF